METGIHRCTLDSDVGMHQDWGTLNSETLVPPFPTLKFAASHSIPGTKTEAETKPPNPMQYEL